MDVAVIEFAPLPFSRYASTSKRQICKWLPFAYINPNVFQCGIHTRGGMTIADVCGSSLEGSTTRPILLLTHPQTSHIHGLAMKESAIRGRFCNDPRHLERGLVPLKYQAYTPLKFFPERCNFFLHKYPKYREASRACSFLFAFKKERGYKKKLKSLRVRSRIDFGTSALCGIWKDKTYMLVPPPSPPSCRLTGIIYRNFVIWNIEQERLSFRYEIRNSWNSDSNAH